MKRFFFGLLVGGILGGVVGVMATVFAYPFIFLADIEASEMLANAESRRIVATGAFIHADPSDSLHYGKGKVTVYEDALVLGSDFEVGPGPKFHAYLVPLDEVTPDTEVDKTMFVDLGQLRAFKGSQVFPIPAGVDPLAYGHVVIWCAQFDVLISLARLAAADG